MFLRSQPWLLQSVLGLCKCSSLNIWWRTSVRSFFDSLFFFFSDLCCDNAISREESFCSPSFFCSHYEWLVFVLSCFCFLPSFVLLFFATKFFSYSFMHQSTYSSTRTKRFYFVSARKKPLPLAPLFFYRTFSSVSLGSSLFSMQLCKNHYQCCRLFCPLRCTVMHTQYWLCAQINVAQF